MASEKPERDLIPPSRALVPVKAGHPSIGLTEELADKICDLVADGKKVEQIAAMEGMPSRATIRRWIANNPNFRREYVLAREEFSDGVLLDTIGISDDSSKDHELSTDGDDMPVVTVNKEAIGRSELRIDTRFRALAKLMPRKYGDPELLEPPESARNGDDAKVINGHTMKLEDHPLYESMLAWGRVAREGE